MPEHRALKFYRWLLRFYPAAFHETYARQMEKAFRDEMEERRSGASSGMWLHLFADLVISVPAQLAREAAQDIWHTFRLWAKRPWQTAFAIIALAIGIGANVGVFSVVNALLLRSLPFRDPDRLVQIDRFQPPHESALQFHEWRSRSAYLADDAALTEEADVTIGGGHGAARGACRTSILELFLFLWHRNHPRTSIRTGRGCWREIQTPPLSVTDSGRTCSREISGFWVQRFV